MKMIFVLLPFIQKDYRFFLKRVHMKIYWALSFALYTFLDYSRTIEGIYHQYLKHCETFEYILEFYRILQNILEHSGTFWNSQKHSRTSLIIHRNSRKVQNIQESSKAFGKILEHSRTFHIILENSRIF